MELAHVHYVIGGVSYDREYFCSHPDSVMAMRLSCGRPGGLSAVVHLTTPQTIGAISVKNNELILQGKLADNGLGYQAVLRCARKAAARRSRPAPIRFRSLLTRIP
jgi:alpha-L-fucosidase 2